MPSSTPANAIVAPKIPAAWKPVAEVAGADPTIVGARFSSLDVAIGKDWDGDVVTSRDVTKVVLHTNLFDIGTIRTSPGRFHFVQHIIDDPAFIVRAYPLEVTATGAGGRTTKIAVPFRLRGRGA